jgi:hypothetical protein
LPVFIGELFISDFPLGDLLIEVIRESYSMYSDFSGLEAVLFFLPGNADNRNRLRY